MLDARSTAQQLSGDGLEGVINLQLFSLVHSWLGRIDGALLAWQKPRMHRWYPTFQHM